MSGDTWGVPGATVHVWDTDVNLFGYFPGGWPYGWFLPWGWRREEIGTAQTDACGNFCVWIPRFDIDWVLRWRLQRRCYIDVFRRPSIRDILERLREVVELPPHIGPWPPDPGPLDFLRSRDPIVRRARPGDRRGRGEAVSQPRRAAASAT